jgi:hypothetical protein
MSTLNPQWTPPTSIVASGDDIAGGQSTDTNSTSSNSVNVSTSVSATSNVGVLVGQQYYGQIHSGSSTNTAYPNLNNEVVPFTPVTFTITSDPPMVGAKHFSTATINGSSMNVENFGSASVGQYSSNIVLESHVSEVISSTNFDKHNLTVS